MKPVEIVLTYSVRNENFPALISRQGKLFTPDIVEIDIEQLGDDEFQKMIVVHGAAATAGVAVFCSHAWSGISEPLSEAPSWARQLLAQVLSMQADVSIQPEPE